MNLAHPCSSCLKVSSPLFTGDFARCNPENENNSSFSDPDPLKVPPRMVKADIRDAEN
jgi:hypothetical protein